MTNAVRYVLKAEDSNDSDREIAQDCHHAGAGSSADLRAIFVERYIADPVASILDAPMVSDQFHQRLGRRFLRREAGHDVGRLGSDLTGPDDRGASLDLGHLSAVGEKHVVVELGRDPDAALLNATVALVQGDQLRGEKTRAPNALRCLASRSVGCP